jgi:hypothetical protein
VCVHADIVDTLSTAIKVFTLIENDQSHLSILLLVQQFATTHTKASTFMKLLADLMINQNNSPALIQALQTCVAQQSGW